MPRCSLRTGLGVAAAVVLAFALHGYHFGVSDQKLYLPAALRAVDPALYPHDAAFFTTEARFTLFDELLAAALRAGVPLDVAMFVGQIVSIAVVAAGGRRVLMLAGFATEAAWAGVMLLMFVLPCPVAGTRIGVLEPYLLPRGLAVGFALWAFAFAIERRSMAVLLLVVAGVLHPLTGLWSAGHVLAQVVDRRWISTLRAAGVAALLLAAIGCAPLLVPAFDESTYWQTALAPESFGARYPWHWPWYEWAGVVAPIALGWIVAKSVPSASGSRIATRLTLSTLAGVVVALIVTVAPDRQWPLQPMRQLHLVYVVVIALAGAWIETRLLRGRLLPRVLAAVLVIGTVVAVQQRYPSSSFVDWPGRLPDNAFVRAFDWIRLNTPVDTRIAIDPFYLRHPGPDWHAARVFTQRSMITDAVHDLAPAAMSPPLAARWTAEQRALAGWSSFQRADFARVGRDLQVSWLVLGATHAPDLDCPFVEPTVRVCRVP